ncbi:hypothetical protein Tco_1173571 [Tanacetum coccineum]
MRLFRDIDFGRKRVSIKLDKQNDPISLEKKIKISPIDYSKLNKIKEDIGKRFVTQKELFAEQVFWLKHSPLSETPVKSILMCRVEALSELHKVNMSQYRFYKNELVLSMSSALINLSSSPQKWTAADRNVEVVPISVLYRSDSTSFSKSVVSHSSGRDTALSNSPHVPLILQYKLLIKLFQIAFSNGTGATLVLHLLRLQFILCQEPGSSFR